VSGAGTVGSPYVFTPTATSGSVVYTLTASNVSGCSNSTTYTVNINPTPTAVTVTPANPSPCANDSAVLLTATGGTTATTNTILAENFDTTAPGWTVGSATTSPTVSNWVQITAPLTDGAGSATFSNFTTLNGGKFMLSNSDAAGSGNTSSSRLTSPSFSTVGYASATVTFGLRRLLITELLGIQFKVI
jgi:hypothetical protein